MEFNAYLPPTKSMYASVGLRSQKIFLEQTVLRRVGKQSLDDAKGITVPSFDFLFVLLAKLALTVGSLFPRYLLSTYCRPGTWLQIFMSRSNHDSPVLYFHSFSV